MAGECLGSLGLLPVDAAVTQAENKGLLLGILRRAWLV